jgi:hypothetical protein
MLFFLNYLPLSKQIRIFMKNTLILIIISLFLPFGNSIASGDSEYQDKLKEKLMGLNILPLAEYPHLLNNITISGKKQVPEPLGNSMVSRLMIYQLLKEGVDTGNLSQEYLSSDIDWKIHQILDMQPGWRDGYQKDYFPKYYAFSPKNFSKEEIVNELLKGLIESPYPLKNLYSNFDKIFNKDTPVYLNDAMFYVDSDEQGFFLVNLLGLNRYSLPPTSSKTGSLIHLGKLKIDTKTLVHEYLHDKISYDKSRKYSLIDSPLLGLKNNTNDITRTAFKIRDIVDRAAEKRINETWWSPLANIDGETTSYNFTLRKDASDKNTSTLEQGDVMYFMEELMVRIVSQLLLSKDGSIPNTLSEIDGLKQYFDNIGASKTLSNFAFDFYGSGAKDSMGIQKNLGNLNAEGYLVQNGHVYLSSGLSFSLDEYNSIKYELIEAFDEVNKAIRKRDKNI